MKLTWTQFAIARRYAQVWAEMENRILTRSESAELERLEEVVDGYQRVAGEAMAGKERSDGRSDGPGTAGRI